MFIEALRVDTEHKESWLVKAATQIDLGLFDSAPETYDEILKFDPLNDTAIRNKENLLHRKASSLHHPAQKTHLSDHSGIGQTSGAERPQIPNPSA